MCILIPFVFFLVAWCGFYRRLRLQSQAWQQSFLYAAALWGTVVFVLTEILSLFHALSLIPLMVAWFLALGFVSYWARPYPWPSIVGVFKSFLSWGLTEKILLAILVVVAVIKGYSALMSAPNTSDAMTYHLSRVEHWIQNGTVAHYPSHVLRQLYSPVWAEYAIAQLRICSGADYYSNAVQWFSCVGSWVGVAALAAMLGAQRRGMLLAVVLAATLPIGLVQATSTQTDYVITFWFVAFVYLLAQTYQKQTWGVAVAAGVCLGLALLTKGNAYIFAPIWLLIFFIVSLKGGFKKLKWLGVILVCAFVFILPYGLRNTMTFGKPNWTHTPLTNDHVSLALTAENIIGNVAFHFKTQSHGEDDTGNLVYVILGLVVLLWMVCVPSLRRNPLYWIYLAGLIGMFLMFCMVMQYQPWLSRFHLSIFVLSCALTGAVIAQWMPRLVLLPVVVIIVYCWPWALACNEHPFLGNKSILKTSRIQQYFSEQPALIFPYTTAVQGVESQNCHDIGVVGDENTWEYPLWVLLKQNYGNQFRLEHVDVQNLTARLDDPKGPFVPCALIALNDRRPAIELPQGQYIRVWYMELPQGITSVYFKRPQ